MKSQRAALRDLVQAVDECFKGFDIDDAIRNLARLRDSCNDASETLDGTPKDGSQTIVIDASTGRVVATFAEMEAARWFCDYCTLMMDSSLRIVEVES